MKQTARTFASLLVVTLPFAVVAHSQSSGRDSSESAKILEYIDNGWNSLSRSMTDCKSIIDPKVTTAPILYLPEDMAIPPAVATVQKQCRIEVRHLPHKITHMGDVRVAEIPDEGLLYLPNPYVVPGGRFNEMYGWDSYFIILGLVEDKRTELARGIVENFFFEIENYGAVLNANRTYFFTRSQPPFLTSMIREVLRTPKRPPTLKSVAGQGISLRRARLRSLVLTTSSRREIPALPAMMTLGKAPFPRWPTTATTILTSFAGCSRTPKSTQTTSSTHRTTQLQPRPPISQRQAVTSPHPKSARTPTWKATASAATSTAETVPCVSLASTPASASVPSAGRRTTTLPSASTVFYTNTRLTWLTSPLCSAATADTAQWNHRASIRRDAINKYLWNPTTGLFYDYDFTTNQQSTYNYLTAFYPLWAGLASPEQASALDHHLSLFEHDGGLAMSDDASGTQWDLPFGWAPTNWLATKGLDQYGFTSDASRIATNFTQTIFQNFEHDGTIREKYNVVSGSANVEVAAGYKANVVGFGWTNGVYLEMNDLLTHPHKKPTTSASQGVHQTGEMATTAK